MNIKSRTPHPMKFILLGFLLENSNYGYELHKRVSDLEEMGVLWRMKPSQIYVMLEEMVKSEYCTVRLIQDSKRPARQEYTITKKGISAFIEWRTLPVTHPREIRQVFLARYFFSSQKGKEITKTLIHNQIKECRIWQKSLAEHANSESEAFQKIVWQYRSMQVKTISTWLEKLYEENNNE